MKRSEVVDLIHSKIALETFTKEQASNVLSNLEAIGMLPPEIAIKYSEFRGINQFNDDVVKYTHRWEKE